MHDATEPGLSDGGSPGGDEARGSTRRRFMLSLGAAIAALAAGSGAVRWALGPRGASRDGEARPRLRDSVALSRQDSGTTLSGGANPDVEVCAVDEWGEAVLRLMDGRHTVEEISLDIARAAGIGRSEALDASIARFTTQVGEYGFLETPYYAYLVEAT